MIVSLEIFRYRLARAMGLLPAEALPDVDVRDQYLNYKAVSEAFGGDDLEISVTRDSSGAAHISFNLWPAEMAN